ncbi:MAG TPA: class I SAM-dependent rRNA methyltransferase, partial [Polyangiaceae bacterium]
MDRRRASQNRGHERTYRSAASPEKHGGTPDGSGPRTSPSIGTSTPARTRASGDGIELTAAAAVELGRGHPWVWRKSIAAHSLDRVTRAAAGDDVLLFAPDGNVVGRGLVDPDSPIAVRVWTTDAARAIDAALIDERVERAFDLRTRIVGDDTTAYRLLHGEGDRTPGIVVDRYADVAVLRLDGDAVRAKRDVIVAAIAPLLKARGVGTLLQRGRADETVVLFGALPSAPLRVTEHGVPFVADVVRGQKTGAFLDQRENRRRVGAMAKGKSVLNLFSYAGGFSLHAALGGATKVTSVDVAAAAHVTAQQSFKAADVDPRAHEFVTADAFAFLENAKKQGKSWNVVVCDPPSFAPNEKSKERALAAYRSLHRACAAVLANGGTFCAASCSSHVDAKTFVTTLDDAALGRSDLRIVAVHGAPADHPIL